MAIQTKATLKTNFETGDTPTGDDYGNLIDSFVGLGETSAQSMSGPLETTELATPKVSATNIISTGNVSANDLYFTREFPESATVAGSGGTQGTANLAGNSLNLLTVTSAAQGVILPGGHPGRVQYFVNTDSAVTAKVYPPSGGNIDAVGADTAVDLLPSRSMAVIHQTSALFFSIGRVVA